MENAPSSFFSSTVTTVSSSENAKFDESIGENINWAFFHQDREFFPLIAFNFLHKVLKMILHIPLKMMLMDYMIFFNREKIISISYLFRIKKKAQIATIIIVQLPKLTNNLVQRKIILFISIKSTNIYIYHAIKMFGYFHIILGKT